MSKTRLHLERLEGSVDWVGGELYRSKIPGGWLVFFNGINSESVTFVPDADHEWDGNSLP
jgi:hypothetical protein